MYIQIINAIYTIYHTNGTLTILSNLISFAMGA